MRALVVVDRLHAVTDDDEFSSYLGEIRKETRLQAGVIPGSEKTWMKEGGIWEVPAALTGQGL